MAVSLKHKFQSAKSDGVDTSVVRPSNWNDEHDLTLAANSLLGRGTGDGAAQEITCTAAGRAILDDADNTAQRVTLGLGTAAVLNAGTGANQVVQLDGSGRMPAVDGSQLTNLPGAVAMPAGALAPYAGGTVPGGWLECNGALVSRTTYAALFTAIGTTYGAGDGSTTFALPNLRDRTIFGSGTAYARGATGGAATVSLTEANLPAHTHSDGTLAAASGGSHTHTGSTSTAGSHEHNGLQTGGGSLDYHPAPAAVTGAFSTTTGVRITDVQGSHSHSLTINSDGAHTHDVTGATGSTGSGTAHDNMPPYVAMLWIIKT